MAQTDEDDADTDSLESSVNTPRGENNHGRHFINSYNVDYGSCDTACQVGYHFYWIWER